MTTQPSSNDVSVAIELARTAANDALAAAASTGSGTGLVPTGLDAAVAVKAQMAGQRAVIAKTCKQALAAQEAAKEIIKAKQAELDAEMRAMAQMLEPLMAQVKLLNEGIWTINLYLGRDEEIHTLTEGPPAPAGTPIHIRQQVLAMDEETAIDAEDGGMDVRSIEQFDEWITADPAHLQQVLPEARGVVAIMPRRKDRDYGDAWANEAINAANKQTWWLIRNGDNLYRMLTDFQVGARLVPGRNEFTSIFVDRWTKEPLQPGTDAWMKAEKAASQRERHFMRIALILQGLVDRTAVFHPLPVAGLSLLAPGHYDEGHVVLIADDENQITSGRTPFYRWLAAKNAQLTPGMRVIVNTRHSSWPDRGRDRYSYDQHPRLHPRRAESPRSTTVHTIAKRTGGGDLSFTYPRTVKEWIGSGRDQEYRVPTTPASCTLSTDDQFVLPIDLVTVAEMRDYLAARTERHAYEEMFPTLTAAIAFKEAEAAEEAPFRALLAAQIAGADSITLDEAVVFVDKLVSWWKVGNRWNRALNGEPDAEVKAARMILAEHAARVRAADGSDQASQTLQALHTAHPKALFIARKKDGTWVVGTASPRRWAAPVDEATNRYRTQAAPLNIFIDLAEYTPTGKARTVKAWQVPEPAVVGRWTMLRTAPQWETWNRRARRAEHLSDPEIEAALAQIQAWAAPQDTALMAVIYNERGTYRTDPPRFEVWYHPNAGVLAPERALTEHLPYVASLTQTVTWSRATTGAVTLRAGRKPSSNGSQCTWTPDHNWGIQPEKVGRFQAPFMSDNRRHQTVFLDETVLVSTPWRRRRRGTWPGGPPAVFRSRPEPWSPGSRTHGATVPSPPRRSGSWRTTPTCPCGKTTIRP